MDYVCARKLIIPTDASTLLVRRGSQNAQPRHSEGRLQGESRNSEVNPRPLEILLSTTHIYRAGVFFLFVRFTR